MIVLIGAMDVEVEFLIANLKDPKKEEISNFVFYKGILENQEVVVVKSGIGKTMAGVLTGTLVNNYPKITHIINVGVAGGVKGLNIGDIVVGNSYVYGDVDLTPAGDYVYGRMANCPFLFNADKELIEKSSDIANHVGTICTTDKFMTDDKTINTLIDNYFSDLDIYCFDMESTAFAHAAYYFKIPFIAIRAISDIIGSEKVDDQYENNFELSSLNSNKFIIKLMKKF